ncbi:MAG: hypothetical protein WBD79_05220 [Anaerolineae bacterium]
MIETVGSKLMALAQPRSLILALALLVLVSCLPPFEGVPADETRVGISLTEAQSLVPFTICLPEYLPDTIGKDAQITYHADFGDPMESDIQLRYYRRGTTEVVVEIVENHWPRASVQYEITDVSKESSLRDLLAWIVGWEKWEEAMVQAQATFSVGQDDQQWSLVEITDPPALRANLIEWAEDPVFYRLYTRLPAQDALQIAVSTTDCLE